MRAAVAKTAKNTIEWLEFARQFFVVPGSGSRDDADILRKRMVLRKVSTLLRRKIGHDREDKAFDEVLRWREVHIAVFSLTGLLMMVIMEAVMWYSSAKTCDTPPYNDPTLHPSCTTEKLPYRVDTYWKPNGKWMEDPLLICMVLMQAYITGSTFYSLLLISHKYYMLLESKRTLWSGIDPADFVYNNAMTTPFYGSYDFFHSSMKYQYLLELFVHIPHPILTFKEAGPGGAAPDMTGYHTCQVAMFARLYLVISIVYRFSGAYRNRVEVALSNHELRRTNFSIHPAMTLKMVFYSHTASCVIASAVAAAFVFSYSMFVIERTNPVPRGTNNFFGKLEQCWWFTFVTFTTIGYGDSFPATALGRVLAVVMMMAGIIVWTLFGGIVTNRFTLTSEHKYVSEFVHKSSAAKEYELAAVLLIQRAYREYRTHMQWLQFIEGRSSNSKEIIMQQNLTFEKRRKVIWGHCENTIRGAITKMAIARRQLDKATLQSKDSITEMHMTNVADIVETMLVSTAKERIRMQAMSASIEERMLEIEIKLKEKRFIK
eukprot:PhF_6_TR34166/c0_g1_i2/m.49979